MNAPLARLRMPQTLRGRIVRLLVVRTAAFAAVVSVLLVGQVMALRPSSAPYETTPLAMPSWSTTLAAAYPDCVAAVQWPHGTPASSVVAHRFADGTTARIDFMSAWNANHDDSDVNDLWVLGICA